MRVVFVPIVLCAGLAGQTAGPARASSETPADPYGRISPRGTVFSFLAACRSADYARASLFLNTKQGGDGPRVLAEQLCTVLNQRLPARLNELSDKPEGSGSFALRPDFELVGTIDATDGKFDILLQRVKRPQSGSIWLFADETLGHVPRLYEETQVLSIEAVLPAFLVRHGISGVPLYELIAIFVGLPLIYFGAGFLGRPLSRIVGYVWRKCNRRAGPKDPNLLSPPVRLILLAVVIRLTVPRFDLPLLARQLWSGIAYMMSVAGVVWILILLNGAGEAVLRRRLGQNSRTGVASFLHFARRLADLIAVFIGVIVIVYYFGLNPTAALAGLGVGGIAVALAAQKTLENVIGGISLIWDSSVHMGDVLRISGVDGVVEAIGLRSTRIRTPDRTVVSVPNGQLANLNVENLSLRDKFWFHHKLNVRLETSVTGMRSALADVRALLAGNPAVESSSARTNFVRVNGSSFEIELFAYLFARDYVNFLTLQEELLLRVIETTDRAGASVAYASQMTYLADPPRQSSSTRRPIKAAVQN
jgi:MscS family membrane protein